jgi:hypothetical protein
MNHALFEQSRKSKKETTEDLYAQRMKTHPQRPLKELRFKNLCPMLSIFSGKDFSMSSSETLA